MSICHASLAGAHDLLSSNDVQALHQTKSQRAPHYAIKEKVAANAVVGCKVRGLGPQGTTLRVPSLLLDASNQGNAKVAYQFGR